MQRILICALLILVLFPATSSHIAHAEPASRTISTESSLSDLSVAKSQLRRSPQTRYYPAGDRALDWAEKYALGRPYQWGATGPYGYDCSGLVYAAFQHVGVFLPRDTYGMLASSKLRPVLYPQRGDLAFFGSGHVEIVTIWGRWVTFGAQNYGTTVGWHRGNAWWHPTMFFRVVY